MRILKINFKLFIFIQIILNKLLLKICLILPIILLLIYLNIFYIFLAVKNIAPNVFGKE